jgi:hypothetical protein
MPENVAIHSSASIKKPKINLNNALISLVDYTWVIIMYSVSAFILAVIIDGYILKPFDLEKTKKESTLILSLQVILQIAVQGFIAIFLHGLLEDIPSPVDGIFGYNSKSDLGNLLRNPAIISVILFALSKSLQGRLMVLYSRFDKNTAAELEKK